MPSRLRIGWREQGFVWCALLTLVLLFFLTEFYGHVLSAPGKVLLAGGGDGLKNYYTLLWHVDRDATAMHYGGSNHPYGESIFYTDGHPALSWLLRALHAPAGSGVAVINLLLLLGLLPAAWLLFALLRESGVPPWASAVGAFSIVLLQPQLLRMGGHYSLAHAWAMPLMMLLSLFAQRGPNRLRWSICAVAAALVLYLTHPYLGLMSTMLLMAHGASRAVLGAEGWRESLRVLLRGAILGVLPMVAFLLIVSATDNAPDRPSGPMGADIYSTRIVSLIVPTHDPFATPIRDFFNYNRLEWETWCYLGLSTLLVLIVAGGAQAKRWATIGAAKRVDDAGQMLGAAFLVLLFAMGVWQGWLAQWLPQLEQFRGTGRFAWPFFFAACLFGVVRLHGWLLAAENARKGVASVVFIVTVGFLAVEGWDYHRESSHNLGRAENPFRVEALLPHEREMADRIRQSGAAGLLPLPWNHVGSEQYDAQAPEAPMARALKLAYHSGVPLMAGLTSRTSVQQTRSLFALFAPSYYPKGMRGALPDSARVMILRHEGPLAAWEESLWRRARPVNADGGHELRLITVGELLSDTRLQRLAEFEQLRKRAPPRGNWRFTVQGQPADEREAGRVRFGPEELHGHVNEWHELLQVGAAELDSGGAYEVDFLFESPDARAVNINLVTVTEDPDGANGRWEDLRGLRSMPMQLADGVCVATLPIRIGDANRRLKVLINGPAKSSAPFVIRHVVLRPVEVDAWMEGSWRGASTVFLNGLPLSHDGAPPPGGS